MRLLIGLLLLVTMPIWLIIGIIVAGLLVIWEIGGCLSD